MRLGLVIIETRKGVGLRETIESHLKLLPDYTPAIVFCSSDNYDEIRYKGEDTFFAEDDYTNYNIEVIASNSLSIYQYNKILVSRLFWDLLPYDKVLITQTDAFMRRKGIEEFMEYDFIGAPHTFSNHTFNGGCSLRTVSVMRDICDKFEYTMSRDGNEDIWFCNIMNQYGIGKLPTKEVAMKFGCESIYSENPLTCHAIEKYHSKEIVEQLKKGI